MAYGSLPIESQIYRAMMLISLDHRDEAKHLSSRIM
jgi:hypothetical protein